MEKIGLFLLYSSLPVYRKQMNVFVLILLLWGTYILKITQKPTMIFSLTNLGSHSLNSDYYIITREIN